MREYLGVWYGRLVRPAVRRLQGTVWSRRSDDTARRVNPAASSLRPWATFTVGTLGRTSLLIIFLSISAPFSLWGQGRTDVLDQRSRQEAVSRLLAMTPDKRTSALAQLLKNPSESYRDMAVDVIDQTFAVSLLPSLRRVAAAEPSQRLRKRIQALAETLAVYEPIATEDLSVSMLSEKAFKKTPKPKSLRSLFTAVPVEIRVQKADGTPAVGCAVQAYSEDYGVYACEENPARGIFDPSSRRERTGYPRGRFQTANESGGVRVELFPGNWTFFAASGAGGTGMYVCMPGVEISREKTVVLKPRKKTTLKFLGPGKSAVDVNDVQVMDASLAGFLNTRSLGPSSDGRFTLWTADDRPLGLVAFAAPPRGPAVLFYAERLVPSSFIELSADRSQAARLSLEPPTKGAPVKEATVEFNFRCVPHSGVSLKVNPPLEVHVASKDVEVSYGYATADGYSFSFSRKGYRLRPGTSEKLILGGPYECSVFHQYYKEMDTRPNVFAYHLFVKDPNGHLLQRCSQSRRRVPISLAIRNGGQVIFDTARTKPDGDFWSEAGSIPSEADLASLRYEITLPFSADKKTVVAGHGADFEKSSEHLTFTAPGELACNADNWLEGAEAIYRIYCDMLEHTPAWARATNLFGRKMAKIRFQIRMPGNVGAYSSLGGTYRVGAGLTVTQPWRILETAFRHEVLHNFGYSHEDFMDIGCQEAAVRYCGDSPAARLKSAGEQDELRLWLLGKGKEKNPDRFVPHILLAEYGFGLFNEYMKSGRAERGALQAAGLSETETDCALFSFLTDGGALSIYRATGAAIDEARMEKSRQVLAKQADGGETAAGSPVRPPSPNKEVQGAEDAFKEKDKAAALLHADVAREQIRGIAHHRTRAYQYCRLAKLLLDNGEKKRAYELFKECQRSAALVDAGYLRKVRGICVKAIQGEPVVQIVFM